MLDPAAHIIRKCGGPDAVADMVGIHPSNVHRWTYPKDKGGTGGSIPSRHHAKLIAAAAAQGVNLTPDDFFHHQTEADTSASAQATNNSANSPAPVMPPVMPGAEPGRFPHRHILGIEGLGPDQISYLLDRAEGYVALSRSRHKADLLRGRTMINLFFEDSTRTRTSFELAGKRLGADTINMSVATSSVHKGESLIDTALTLNAMHPDVLIVRHPHSGAVELLSQKVACSVINGGDGSHEHPTQALLDALTIRRRKGRIGGLIVAICGDIAHSRVARSNIHLLNTMGARVRVIGPPTLIPTDIDRMGVEVFHDMRKGLKDCDIVMMLRLQLERMHGTYVPSLRENFHYYGLDYDKLASAKPDALIMHPGPINRGVEIDTAVADDVERSVITEQVEMGVAVRMACLEAVTANFTPNDTRNHV
ncbi:MAG: aspartate carbamoyltransferase catalytic subunit [Alphaproteobacteria bacterium]|jgi:aspartate carbamoyltransferase catalytic subunit